MVPWILWVCVLMFYFDQPQYHRTLMDNICSSWNIHYRRNIMELLIINHPILGTYIRQDKYYVHIITNIISVIFWGL